MNFRYIAFIFFSITLISKSFAQVYSVEPIEKGLQYSSDVTQTFLWANKASKAILIFIPGGEGQVKLKPDRKDMGGFYGTTLKPLSDSGKTSGLFDVVVFDSPMALPVGSSYPSSRATADHLMRIESVVLFYKNKLNKPVWLMGHSNGAVSVTEFYKYLQDKKQENLISGIIYSSARNGASFKSNTNLPVLFLAHEKDGCARSTPYNSKMVYEALKKTNSEKTEYVLLKGGEAEADEPCRSGYHMFYGASSEAYKAVDTFASSFYK
jgi:hypothetical protein